MSLTTIKLTQFRVEKLQCIGGEGRSSPYRITVYEGGALGEIGSVTESVAEEMAEAAHLEAANHGRFEQHGAMGFKRLLTMFGK